VSNCNLKKYSIIGVALFALLSCSGESDSMKDADGRIRAVATIGMIADVVRNVGGDHVHITGLMGPGIDPHLYRARESDVSAMARADVIFYNGLHLEARMADVFARMRGRTRTVAVAEAVPKDSLLQSLSYGEAYDPHVWFDVPLWMHAVERVRDELIEIDSTNAADYRANADAYLGLLTELHREILEKAAQLPEEQRVIVTSHDAFRYLGRRYGFEVRGLQGISTVSEAGAADLQELAQFIVDRRVPAIFVESSVPRRNIEAVRAAVRSRGWEVKIGGVLFSDAMGNPGALEGEYPGMIRHNINTIVAALSDRSLEE
jgi:manganese/zinc/iron transport system substrate-binding protein